MPMLESNDNASNYNGKKFRSKGKGDKVLTEIHNFLLAEFTTVAEK